ncbi:hypothetical protein J3R83DRAFT_5763 [Lanmaoa asiatica]|nr:hypothetical protein J3R83DRAFT_5763 [Lanmaoa asiatica]
MSASEQEPIINYDIPSITPGRTWSPNTMKTRFANQHPTTRVVVVEPQNLTDHHIRLRYCLGYKQLLFTTVWVEFPDIAGLLQSKGVTHPTYTLPAIKDPNTGTFIMDSLAIATYLDETYPETPNVFSLVARAVLEKVGNMFSFGSSRAGELGDAIALRLVFLILCGERLNPVSKAYYYQTRGACLGEQWKTLVDACSASPEDRAERVSQGIEAIRGVWHKVTALYVRQSNSEEEGQSGGPLVLGEEPSLILQLRGG